MDVTPTAHIIRGLQNSNIGWATALSELIDNSFDAAANRVVVKFKGRELIVEDDGRGAKDVSSMARLGDHNPSSSTALGMFGVGLKDAWFWCGGLLDVESVHGGTLSKVVVDPEELIQTNWIAADPTTEPTTRENGTRIRLPLGRQRNSPGDACIQQLRWVFTPALLAGKQIVFSSSQRAKKETLSALALPRLIDSVRDSFDVDGKKVEIEIGIVADGEQMKEGPFWVSYRHRNITSSSIGAGRYSTMRMGGCIRLLEGWSLTKNKDDLSAYKSQLGEAIEMRIRHLLIKAEQLSQDIEATALKTEIEEMVNSSFEAAKREARDQNRQQQGTVLPVNSGIKRKNAAKVSNNPGSVAVMNGKRKTGFTISWFYGDDSGIGKFDDTGDRVTLNLNHPFIASMKQNGDKIGIYCCAVAILTDYLCTHKDRQKTLMPVEDFGKTFGLIIGSVQERERNEKAAG
jgi:hypothetical protein